MLTLGSGSSVAALRPTMKAQKASRAPTIDGSLDDSIWRRAARVELVEQLTGKKPEQPTQAYLLYDDAALYIGFYCHESKLSRLKVKERPRDGGVYSDDNVEVFLDPSGKGEPYFHFIVNASGYFKDQRSKEDSWNPANWQVKTSRKKDGWQAELKLPFAVLEQGPQIGRVWRINFNRVRRLDLSKPQLSAWSAILEGTSHDYRNFGYLKGLVVGEKREKGAPWRVKDAWPTGPAKIGDNLLEVEIKGNKGSVKAEVEVTGPSGEKRTIAQKPIVLTRRTGKFKLNYTVAPEQGAHTVTVKLKDAQTGKLCYTSPPFNIEIGSLLRAYVTRNYYTTEKKATVKVEIEKMSPARLQGLAVDMTVRDAAGKQVLSAKASPLAPELKLTIPVGELAVGEYSVAVELKEKKGKVLSRTEEKLVKLAPNAHEVKIDRERICILFDGEPFLPIGPFVNYGDIVRDKSLIRLKEAGFNWLMLSGNGMGEAKGDVGKIRAVLDNVHEYGLKAQLVFDDAFVGPKYRKYSGLVQAGKGPRSYGVTRAVEKQAWHEAFAAMADKSGAFKDHPALLNWYGIDEAVAGDMALGYNKNIYDILHKADPYHPVMQLFASTVVRSFPDFFSKYGYELAGNDPYFQPQTEGQILQVAAITEMNREMTDRTRTPLISVLVGGLYSGAAREPSGEEHCCQMYLAVIHGAKGLSFFTFDTMRHPGSWAGLSRTTKELLELAPVILEPTPKQEVLARAAHPLHLVIKRHRAKLYLITINAGREAVKATFDLRELRADSAVKVLFEGRKLKANGTVFTDTYEGYARHVYELAPAGPESQMHQLKLSCRTLGRKYDPDRDSFFSYKGVRYLPDFNEIALAGRSWTLAEIAKELNNPDLFTYDAQTRTARCKAEMGINYGARLVIGDKADPRKGEMFLLAAFKNFPGVLGKLEIYNSTVAVSKWSRLSIRRPGGGHLIGRNSVFKGFQALFANDGGTIDIRDCEIDGEGKGHYAFWGVQPLKTYKYSITHARETIKKAASRGIGGPFRNMTLRNFRTALTRGNITYVDSEVYNVPRLSRFNDVVTYINCKDDGLARYDYALAMLINKWHVKLTVVDGNGRPVAGRKAMYDTRDKYSLAPFTVIAVDSSTKKRTNVIELDKIGEYDEKGVTDKNGVCVIDLTEYIRYKKDKQTFTYDIKVGGKGGAWLTLKKGFSPGANTAFRYVEGEDQLEEVAWE